MRAHVYRSGDSRYPEARRLLFSFVPFSPSSLSVTGVLVLSLNERVGTLRFHVAWGVLLDIVKGRGMVILEEEWQVRMVG